MFCVINISLQQISYMMTQPSQLSSLTGRRVALHRRPEADEAIWIRLYFERAGWEKNVRIMDEW